MGFMLLIDVLALGAVAFIVWWFWIYKPRASSARSTPGAVIEIVVADGVYSPAHIELAAGQSTVLRFLRQDPAPCAELVQFPDLDISTELPLGKPVEVQLPVLAAGDYAFSCQMQMYRGTLSVK